MTPHDLHILKATLLQRGHTSLEAYKDALMKQYALSENTVQWYISMCCYSVEDMLELLPDLLNQHAANHKWRNI